MSERSYWLDLFTAAPWQEFIAAGGEVSGFRESRWKTVQRLRPGDLCRAHVWTMLTPRARPRGDWRRRLSVARVRRRIAAWDHRAGGRRACQSVTCS